MAFQLFGSWLFENFLLQMFFDGKLGFQENVFFCLFWFGFLFCFLQNILLSEGKFDFLSKKLNTPPTHTRKILFFVLFLEDLLWFLIGLVVWFPHAHILLCAFRVPNQSASLKIYHRDSCSSYAGSAREETKVHHGRYSPAWEPG